MADKRWYVVLVPGVGDVACWADVGAFESGLDRIEIENLTQVVSGPNGEVGTRKITDYAVLNLMTVPWWTTPPKEMIPHLSKIWDVPGQIVLPTDGERKRLFKND